MDRIKMPDPGNLNLENFGNIIDNFLTDNDISMLVMMPAGTQKAKIVSNVNNMGPVIQFYILLAALPQVYSEFREILDREMEEDFIDKILEMVKSELMEEINGGC